MMKPLIIPAGILLIMVSCQNNNNTNNANTKNDEHCRKSSSVINGDTLNILGCNGREGIWVPQHDNELKDTIFYKNGKADILPEGWTTSNNRTRLLASGFKE
jgi:hypothetical protein